LEVELSVWKQAHSVALEGAERESKAHNVQITTLNRQISNMDVFRNVRFCTRHGGVGPLTAFSTEPTAAHTLCYRRR
jgi:hypothetical protein